jgi:hypothetical protein
LRRFPLRGKPVLDGAEVHAHIAVFFSSMRLINVSELQTCLKIRLMKPKASSLAFSATPSQTSTLFVII